MIRRNQQVIFSTGKRKCIGIVLEARRNYAIVAPQAYRASTTPDNRFFMVAIKDIESYA